MRIEIEWKNRSWLEPRCHPAISVSSICSARSQPLGSSQDLKVQTMFRSRRMISVGEAGAGEASSGMPAWTE
jgi:hypothetical protein